MKRLRLNNAREVRRSLTRVANLVLNGDLDPKRANSIISASNVILSAIKTDELEKRIDEIEDILEGSV